MSDRVFIFDTTLRDGEQALPSSLSPKEKIAIAKQLERLKVDTIEAGFPISSPGDFLAVSEIAKTVQGPYICALARCKKEDIEQAAKAVRSAAKPCIHVFVGTSPIHRETQLRKDKKQVLEMAVASVKQARHACERVEFSPMDAGRTEPDYLYQVVEETIAAGALIINIPDTVGYTTPQEFGELIAGVMNHVCNVDKAIISVHCHNDLGLATANSISAVLNGARQIECTINGLGERAGNCSLEEAVMILRTRPGYFGLDTGVNAKEIYNTSRLVSRLCNTPVQPNKAIVGSNAFSHSSGIHQDGVLKNRQNYEIITPQSIGLKTNRMNLTSRSGSHMVFHRLKELGYTSKDYQTKELYSRFLALADKKGRVYDDDLIALAELGGEEIRETFVLEFLNAVSGRNTIPTATVRLKTPTGIIQEAATGDGPVDACYNALERVTGIKLKLEDYKLAALGEGRGAMGKVDIIGAYQSKHYHGVGTSTDIVEASALAYLNAVNKIIGIQGKKKSSSAGCKGQKK